MGLFNPIPPQNRNPDTAAILSALCPGLGQVYNYQLLRGLVFLVVFILFIPFIIPSVFLWIVAIRDAYKYAQELNKDTMSGFPMREIEKKKTLSSILRRN